MPDQITDHIEWLQEFIQYDEPQDDEQRAEATRRLGIIAKIAAERAIERDESRRAHIRSVFHCGDTAVVNNHEMGIRATKCYSRHEVAVIWWGDNEADRLFPGEE